jgi:DNA polymerase III epsilon subunit-like protein
MPLPKLPFVVLDTETTGLTPRADRVIELALVRFENGEKVSEYEQIFSVDMEMSPVTRALTRLKPEDLKGAPPFSIGAQHAAPLLEGAVIIGQNITFDLAMLKGEGLNLDNYSWIDSAMLASIVFPEAASYSLGYLSSWLGLPHEPKHRAMGDVIATIALLEKTWERLNELPTEDTKKIKELSEKGPEGYAGWFSSMGEGGSAEKPEWLQNSKFQICPERSRGVPNSSKRTWLAVKNLDATLAASDSEGHTPVFAPAFVLNPRAADTLLIQESFTADELTLAIKLHLYKPKHHRDFPMHGAERDVWKGKLACTKETKAYTDQFDPKENILIDHRQLLELLLHDHDYAPKESDAVIIDDASMLEDTATKAFKWFFAIDPLRAAAEGKAELTGFLDACQIWIEKVRNFQDIRYLVEADVISKEARGLKERLNALIETSERASLIGESLANLQHILNPENLRGRITYIEQFRNGGQSIQSVPQNVAVLLNDLLYAKCKTALLLPPGDPAEFSPIFPPGSGVEIITETLPAQPPLLLTEEMLTIERLLPRVDGRVICIVSGKRAIEQFYVKCVESLEEQGITLIAQGLSGGQGRMQAEFLTGGERVVWLLTPWMYEGVELPAGSVDHLWIHTLPFDHPSHAVLAKRADAFGRGAFDLYFVPRLLQRLFRLLRTYSQHRTDQGDILLFDQRVKSKNYGERVMRYLRMLTTEV